MHRVPEGLTHEMPSGGQREGLLIPTLLDSPGQDPPPHPTRLGLGSPSWSIKGWAGNQHREHLCSVINGQTASAGGEGLSTPWATRGSLLSSPLPPSGKNQGCQLGSQQLEPDTTGCRVKLLAPPTIHAASCPDPPGASEMPLRKKQVGHSERVSSQTSASEYHRYTLSCPHRTSGPAL